MNEIAVPLELLWLAPAGGFLYFAWYVVSRLRRKG